VSKDIEDFLLGSDWLEKQGAKWDFSAGTVTLGDSVISVHQRHRNGLCRRVLVTQNFTVPAKDEANIPVRLVVGEEEPSLPPCDWAIEPKSLGPGVMAARTVLSDSQSACFARVLNNSLKPRAIRVNTFLSMAEPVQCVAESGGEPSNLSASNSDDVSVLLGESSGPAPSALRPATAQSDGPGFRTSTVSSQPAADVIGQGPSQPCGSQYDHIFTLLHHLPLDLTDEQHARAKAFIRSRVKVFSRSDYDIGHTNIIPHCMDTGDHTPNFAQLHRHPTTQLPVIDKHVQHMLDHNVIEPAASPWCSNVVMVRKQDGTMRLCVDYRKLNSLTTKDKFPLPKIDTCLDTLNGCEYFSTCDLHWGYWQTEINERDRDKTAFVTCKGQWWFKVLSFGLANAPSQFARIMERVMSGLTYDICLVYLDDILVFSRTFDEHLERLSTVFDRLE